jgi:Tfp pilus assembly protein PilF
MIRALCFFAYHLVLLALIVALQGCASFNSPSLPWSKDKAEDPMLTATSGSSGIAKGVNYERAGQFDKAREVYEKLLSEQPNSPEPLHRLAVVADKQRRHQEAQALYTQVIKMQPKNAELFNDLGYSFYLSGQMPKAESALAKAVQMEPENPRFRNNLGMVMGQQGRIQDAFDQFSRAGSEADAHYNVAFIYASQGRAEEAKACFLRALAVDPTHSKASKALEAFRRYEQNGGMALDEDTTPDGRRLIPYIEDADGNPDTVAMSNFDINHHVDSVMPGKHNLAQNRAGGETIDAARSQRNTSNARGE